MPHDEIENQKLNYLPLRDGLYLESEEILPGIVGDFDYKGELLGLELPSNMALAELLKLVDYKHGDCLIRFIQSQLLFLRDNPHLNADRTLKPDLKKFCEDVHAHAENKVSEVTGEDFYVSVETVQSARYPYPEYLPGTVELNWGEDVGAERWWEDDEETTDEDVTGWGYDEDDEIYLPSPYSMD